MRRRFLAMLLCLCMVVTLLPAAALAATTEESAGSASYGEMLNPTAEPGMEWETDASNPYGTNRDTPFALNPVNELVLYTNQGNTTQIYLDDFDKGTGGTLLDNSYYIIDKTITDRGGTTGQNTRTAGYVSGVAFDPYGTGRADHAAFIGFVTAPAGNLRYAYWIQDLTTGECSQFAYLQDWPEDHDWFDGLTQYQAKNFFSLTAGDYDGDGKETVFYTYPGSGNIYQMKLPNEDGEFRYPGYDSQITWDKFAPAAGDTSKTAKITDQLSISLATGDFDKDGVDELAVSAGLCYTAEINDKDLPSFADTLKYATSLTLFNFTKDSGSDALKPAVVSQVNNRLLMTCDASQDETDSSIGIITTKYYNNIRYAGIAAGDINGDGYDDVVIAGYLGSVTQRSSVVQGEAAESSTVHGAIDKEKVAYAICYGGSNTVTEVQTTDMNKYTKTGLQSGTAAAVKRDVHPQFTVVCASLDGYGTAEYTFIMGSVYTFNAGGAASLALTTDRGQTNGDRTGERWYDCAVAGNFDGNAAGREQIVAVAFEKVSERHNYDCYVDTIGGYSYSDKKDSSGNIVSYGSVEYLYSSSHSFKGGLVHKDKNSSVNTDTGEQFSCLVLAADVDNDGLLVKYMTKGYGYSDAQVQAVLQAAPYFGELGDYDQDFSDGTTTYSISNGYTNTSSTSNSVSFGFALATEHEFKVYKFSVTVGATVDWTQTFEKSLSVEYSSEFSASGDDTVVLYRVPATTYYYAVCNPNTGEFEYDEKNAMAVMVPEAPVYTTMDKETYNNFVTEYNALHAEEIAAGAAKALPSLTSEVLPENATGDPFAYWRDYGVVSDPNANTTGTVSGFTSLSDNLKQLGIGSGSISSGWTSSSEYSEGTETSAGFSVSTSHMFGGAGHYGGFEAEFGYSRATGTVYTTMESRGASGTVNSLDQKALLSNYGIPYAVTDQYDFKWDFGMRTWTLSDALNAQQIPVFGYVLTGVRAAPPVPLELTAEVKSLDTVALEWSAPAATARAYDGYNVWCAKNGGEYVKLNTDLLGTDETTYQAAGLDSNTKYTFVVSTQLTTQLTEETSKTVDGSFSQPAQATTSKKNYTVTYGGSNADISASYLGDIGIASGASVAEESIVFVTAVPKTGYTITGISLTTPDGTESVTPVGGKFNFILRGDTTIEVNTAPVVESSELTFKQPELGGGSFTASVGGVAVDGEAVVVTDPVELAATPEDGYVLKAWLVDQNQIPALGKNTMTFTPYQETHTISALFVEENDPDVNVALTVNTGNGGTLEITDASGAVLTPASGSLSLRLGTEVTITARPNSHYSLQSWTDALSDYGKDTQSVTLCVTEPMAVGAAFYAPIQYPISFSAGANGTLTAAMDGAPISGAKTNVVPGSSIAFTASAESGYRISGWTVTGFGARTVSYADRLVTSETLNLTDITAASTVRVNFAEIKTYTLTFDPGAGTGAQQTAQTNELTEYTLPANTFTAPESMVFNSWQIGQRTYSAGDKCVFDGDTTITALWRAASDNGGGGGGGVIPSPNSKTPVIVDGVSYDIGTAETEGGVTTVTVDQTELPKQLAAARETVVIPITSEEKTVVAQLIVGNIEEMAKKKMTLSVAADGISYDLPASAIDMAELMKAIGATDSKLVSMSITIKKLENGAVTLNKGSLVVPPVSFTVTASYNGKIVEVQTFGQYVRRVIEITAEQAGMITTGVVAENGTERHVPTNVYQKDGKWYEAVATEMASREIINGHSSDIFDGDANITRAEFAAILVRALGLPADGNAGKFTDVSKTTWYFGAVGTAYEYGLVNGKDETHFDPNANITRQEAMAMVYRASKITELAGTVGDLDKFSDAGSVNAWALDSARWNVGSGLIQGNGAGMICGQDNITRGETATIILRLLQKSELVDVRTKA